MKKKVNVKKMIDDISKNIFNGKHTGLIIPNRNIMEFVDYFEHKFSVEKRLMLKNLIRYNLKDFFNTDIGFRQGKPTIFSEDIMKRYRLFLINDLIKKQYPGYRYIQSNEQGFNPERNSEIVYKFWNEQWYDETISMINIFVLKRNQNDKLVDLFFFGGNNINQLWENDIKYKLCGVEGFSLGEKGKLIKDELFTSEDTLTLMMDYFGDTNNCDKIKIGNSIEFYDTLYPLLKEEKLNSILKNRAFKYLLNSDNFEFFKFHNLLNNETENISSLSSGGGDWCYL